jgi:oxygen-independent coproporphyrinogen-3 oxidase
MSNLLLIDGLNTFEDFLRVYRDARAAGFDDINIDLMFGLPGQTMSQWKDTLSTVATLAPQHVSAYALSIEEGAAYGRLGLTADEDLEADMYELAAEKLTAAGFAHYEISNWARPGRECRHNLKYWKNLDCLGLGLSAAGYDGGLRRKNREDLDGYLTDLAAGRRPVESEEKLSGSEARAETVILALRLKTGVEIGPLDAALFGPILEKYTNLGFLHAQTVSLGTRLYTPTLAGWRLSNSLFADLLEAGQRGTREPSPLLATA